MNQLSIKNGVVIAVILLFISVSVIPSTGTTDVKQDNHSFLNYSSPISPPSSGLIYIVPPIVNWYKYREYIPTYKMVENWNNKPFPNITLMYIGSGIGFRPKMNVSVIVYAMLPDNPEKVNVYSNGDYYDTIYPEFFGPISLRRYKLFYNEKGFHRLTFIAGDNSSSLDIDVQIGFRGFIKHILPYLIK